ncbi:MAG: hypothetical protein NTV46_21950 [Verrucomicrobia bacterium]|nr:hypothetical protein [Verrucomicrobiota bacterium]
MSILAKHEVRYLIIGGYAVMKYTEPRWTKDLDLLIATDPENARAVFAALKDFGAPLAGLSAGDFTDAGSFYQMGRPPMRVDVMMSIPGVTFEQAWLNKETMEITGTPAFFISREDLMLSKQAASRPQDLIDLENLRKNP